MYHCNCRCRDYHAVKNAGTSPSKLQKLLRSFQYIEQDSACHMPLNLNLNVKQFQWLYEQLDAGIFTGKFVDRISETIRNTTGTLSNNQREITKCISQLRTQVMRTWSHSNLPACMYNCFALYQHYILWATHYHHRPHLLTRKQFKQVNQDCTVYQVVCDIFLQERDRATTIKVLGIQEDYTDALYLLYTQQRCLFDQALEPADAVVACHTFFDIVTGVWNAQQVSYTGRFSAPCLAEWLEEIEAVNPQTIQAILRARKRWLDMGTGMIEVELHTKCMPKQTAVASCKQVWQEWIANRQYAVSKITEDISHVWQYCKFLDDTTIHCDVNRTSIVDYVTSAMYQRSGDYVYFQQQVTEQIALVAHHRLLVPYRSPDCIRYHAQQEYARKMLRDRPNEYYVHRLYVVVSRDVTDDIKELRLFFLPTTVIDTVNRWSAQDIQAACRTTIATKPVLDLVFQYVGIPTNC